MLEVKRLAPLTLEWAFEDPFEDNYFDKLHPDNEEYDDIVYDYDDVDEDWANKWDDKPNKRLTL